MMNYSSNLIGKSGESLIYLKLKWLNVLGYKGLILRNIYIPKGNNRYNEIDLLFITFKGLFIIESKNYTGYVYGSLQGKYWLIRLYGNINEKYRLYNPIRQNDSHIKYLLKYLDSDIKTYSLIVFSNRSRLQNIPSGIKDTYIIKRYDLNKYLKDIFKHHEDILSLEEMKDIYEKLLSLTKVSDEVKDRHIDDVRRYYK